MGSILFRLWGSKDSGDAVHFRLGSAARLGLGHDSLLGADAVRRPLGDDGGAIRHDLAHERGAKLRESSVTFARLLAGLVDIAGISHPNRNGMSV